MEIGLSINWKMKGMKEGMQQM